MNRLTGAHIHITGIVQGVGFRPFVYGLAIRYGLSGWVRNTSAGVDIEVDGEATVIDQFIASIQNETPPLAHIDTLESHLQPPNGHSTFEIVHSETIPDAFQPVSADMCICPDCLRELFDPGDRRFLYPFINCTNCGPRFTIIKDIPYDRPKTTMSGFSLCPDCAKEYADPLDRRFHAQPVACPVCGPRVWLEYANEDTDSSDTDKPAELSRPIRRTQQLLADGKILAIKGLGGFHLACDAMNDQAVVELRKRKLRVDKPFALMAPDLATIEKHCYVSEAEKKLLTSPERPIVLLRRRPDSPISPNVAPRQDTLGMMLPYTPLHYLLLPGAHLDHLSSQDRAGLSCPEILIMTSANLSEEPIVTDNQEARIRLKDLADAFLMHNRPIRTRCDDSVTRIVETPAPLQVALRRSRGYAPSPLRLEWDLPPLLATGTELKNTFCLTRDRYAFVSHHIGDMENFETLQSFEDGIQHFERLFRIHPQVIAYDLHPDYLATRYALDRAQREELPATGIQHHHAHIASCMLENRISPNEPVIGVAFDGTGYGLDGAIWGCEFLVATYTDFKRAYHLAYYPLPGGDAAIRKPARIALAYLHHANMEWLPDLAPVAALCAEERTVLRSQLEKQISTPLNSSMGRLFDAAAALLGLRAKVNYEAQAAIEMEALSDPFETGSYTFDYHDAEIDPAPVLEAMVNDLLNHTPIELIAARFHNSVARMVLEVCNQISMTTHINKICLSGGVWQNMLLFTKTLSLLQKNNFEVLTQTLVPPNDGGVSLGQAAIAAQRFYNK